VNGSGSGNPCNTVLEKQVKHLKRAAMNRDIELVKANAKHKAYKQATATVSYSQRVAPTQVVPAPAHRHPQPGFPSLQSAQQVAAVDHTPDLANILLRLDARMAAMEAHMSLSRTA
jgi:sRNA-binding protein